MASIGPEGCLKEEEEEEEEEKGESVLIKQSTVTLYIYTQVLVLQLYHILSLRNTSVILHVFKYEVYILVSL